MTIQLKLQELVKDAQKNMLDESKIEKKLIILIHDAFKEYKDDPEKITKMARDYSRIFHPDSISHCPEIIWLERTLGQYSPDDKPFSKAVCFKIFSRCKDSVLRGETIELDTEPDNKLDEDYSIQSMKNYCVRMKNSPDITHIQLHFYNTFIACLDEILAYNNKVDLTYIKPLRIPLKVLPPTITTAMGLFLANELIMFYGLCITYNFLGSNIKAIPGYQYKLFGTAMEAGSKNMAIFASSNLVKMHSLITSACSKSYDSILLNLKESQKLLKIMMPGSEKDSILAITNYHFQSPQLEQVTAPLNNYLIHTDQQYMKFLRSGQKKSDAVFKFLETVIAMDIAENINWETVWDLLRDLDLSKEISKNKGTIQQAIHDSRDQLYMISQLQNSGANP